MVRRAVLSAAAAAGAALAALLVLPLLAPPEATVLERTRPDNDRVSTGEPLRVSDLAGPAPQAVHALAAGGRVIVLKMPRDAWSEGLPGHVLDHPAEPGNVLVAYAGASPSRGCGVLLTVLDGMPVLLDPCDQLVWDPVEAGAPIRTGAWDVGALERVPLLLRGGGDPVVATTAPPDEA